MIELELDTEESGTFFLIFDICQARLRSDKNNGAHHHQHSACITDKIQKKLAASLDFEDFTSTYRAKMKVYGQVSALDDESNVYTAASRGQMSHVSHESHGPGHYGHSVLHEDVSDDYAEPHIVDRNSHEQIYQCVNLPPVISHSSLSSPSSLDISNTR